MNTRNLMKSKIINISLLSLLLITVLESFRARKLGQPIRYELVIAVNKKNIKICTN